MTARCILEGHELRRFPGHGSHEGQEFDICVHCGKTYTVAGGVRATDALDAPMPLRWPVPRTG